MKPPCRHCGHAEHHHVPHDAVLPASWPKNRSVRVCMYEPNLDCGCPGYEAEPGHVAVDPAVPGRDQTVVSFLGPLPIDRSLLAGGAIVWVKPPNPVGNIRVAASPDWVLQLTWEDGKKAKQLHRPSESDIRTEIGFLIARGVEEYVKDRSDMRSVDQRSRDSSAPGPQPGEPQATYERIAAEVSAIVTKKQAAYGDSFGKSGAVMRILYPGGIRPDQMDDALVVVRILDKLFRIATDRDALGEDPWRDVHGYSLLAVSRGRRQGDPT